MDQTIQNKRKRESDSSSITLLTPRVDPDSINSNIRIKLSLRAKIAEHLQRNEASANPDDDQSPLLSNSHAATVRKEPRLILDPADDADALSPIRDKIAEHSNQLNKTEDTVEALRTQLASLEYAHIRSQQRRSQINRSVPISAREGLWANQADTIEPVRAEASDVRNDVHNNVHSNNPGAPIDRALTASAQQMLAADLIAKRLMTRETGRVQISGRRREPALATTRTAAAIQARLNAIDPTMPAQACPSELSLVRRSRDGFFMTHFNGDAPLGKSYWVNYSCYSGFLIGILISVVLFSTGQSFVMRILMAILGVVAFLWGGIGVWRSARRTREEGGGVFWSIAAQTMIVIGGIITSIQTVYLVFF